MPGTCDRCRDSDGRPLLRTDTYSNGHGGCCAAWSGDHSPYGPMGNYFCGNASAGGWVGFNDPRGMPGSSGVNGTLDDGQPAGYNGSQGLSAQVPWGFNYDPEAFPLLDSIEDPSGAIMHVWSHGWFVRRTILALHLGCILPRVPAMIINDK